MGQHLSNQKLKGGQTVQKIDIHKEPFVDKIFFTSCIYGLYFFSIIILIFSIVLLYTDYYNNMKENLNNGIVFSIISLLSFFIIIFLRFKRYSTVKKYKVNNYILLYLLLCLVIGNIIFFGFTVKASFNINNSNYNPFIYIFYNLSVYSQLFFQIIVCLLVFIFGFVFMSGIGPDKNWENWYNTVFNKADLTF